MDENFTVPEAEETASVAPVSFFEQIRPAMSSAIMLILAICLSAATALPMFEGSSLSLFNIFLTIAAWMIYAGAKSGKINLNGYKIVSGVVKAESVLYWVGAVCCAIGGILIFTCSGMITTVLPSIMEELSSDEAAELRSTLAAYGLDTETLLSSEFLGTALIGAGIGLLVGAGLFVLFAVLFKKLNGFTKSLCVSVETGTRALTNARFAKGLVLFFAIAQTISAVTSIGASLTFVAAAANCAAYYLLYVILSKNFID